MNRATLKTRGTLHARLAHQHQPQDIAVTVFKGCERPFFTTEAIMEFNSTVEITTRSTPNGQAAYYVSFLARDEDGKRVRVRMRVVNEAHAQEIAHRIERGIEYAETFSEE